MKIIKGIVYRIRYWFSLLRIVRPSSKGIALSMFLLIFLDIPFYVFFRKNPITLYGGYVYIKRWGVRFYIRSRTDDIYYVTPGREKLIESFIVNHLKEGDTFVDIGANIGYYTVIGAKCVKDVGKVIAIEPIIETARILRFNCDLNGLNNVDVISRCAWKNSFEKIVFYIPLLDNNIRLYGMASIKPITNYCYRKISKTVAMDDILKTIQNITMMKIDVEGSEYDVIQGAVSSLSKTNFLYIECRKDNVSKLLDMLSKLKFKIHYIYMHDIVHLFCIHDKL